MNNKQNYTVPSLLTALRYEKASFDDGGNNVLYSKELPLKLYIGRMANNPHRSFVLKILSGGHNFLLQSSDKSNLHRMLENAYISSQLNERTMSFFYIPVGYDSFDRSVLSDASSNYATMISNIDNLYALCKENEKCLPEEKKLLVIMISNLSDIPFFSDILIEDVSIKRPQFPTNPFDMLFADETDTLATYSYAVDDNDESLSVNDKLKELLENGEKYGIAFIIGESCPTVCAQLKRMRFSIVELDSIKINNIVTRALETDRILAWEYDAPEKIDSFLRSESPVYAYRTIGF